MCSSVKDRESAQLGGDPVGHDAELLFGQGEPVRRFGPGECPPSPIHVKFVAGAVGAYLTPGRHRDGTCCPGAVRREQRDVTRLE